MIEICSDDGKNILLKVRVNDTGGRVNIKLTEKEALKLSQDLNAMVSVLHHIEKMAAAHNKKKKEKTKKEKFEVFLDVVNKTISDATLNLNKEK
jgi:K+/H+ antiporter YhaU regulatory subunit KhtT